MAETTGISWCDATWNPWWGCEKVSPGCAHCYAERDSTRYGFDIWGPDHAIRYLSDANWRKPLLWARKPEKILPSGADRRPRVFCASMADVFEERDELDDLRDRLFDMVAETPQLDWLMLTKRPEFARDWMSAYYSNSTVEPLPNLWLGVSIENSRFTWRAEVLREIPAALRFLSCEPLLGSLFENATTSKLGQDGDPDGDQAPRLTREHLSSAPSRQSGAGVPRRRAPLDFTGIDWVIVGGESGSRANARPMHPEWAEEIRDAVHRAESSPVLHMKQWGSWTPDPNGNDPNGVWVLRDGGYVTSFAADAYGVEMNGAMRMRYAGPRPGDGGKILDGVDYCGFPSPRTLTPA